MKKIAAVIACVLTIVVTELFLCIPIFADAQNVYVLRDIGSFTVQNNIEKNLHIFTETNEGWDTEKESGYVTVCERTDVFPYTSLTGDGCLIYRKNGAVSFEDNFIFKKYTQPLDLTETEYLIIPVNCKQVENAEYTFVFEMRSGNRKFSVEHKIECESWNGVFIDISSFAYRNKVDTLRMSVKFQSSTNKQTADFEYQVDSILLSDNREIINVFSFSANNYVDAQGNNTVQNGKMIFEPTEQNSYIGSYGFAYRSLGDANSIRLDFSTDGVCRGVSLYTYDSFGIEIGNVYLNTDQNENKHTLYFPASYDEIGSIRLIFDLAEYRPIEIKSIKPYSVYLNKNDLSGGIDACAINRNNEEILIKGEVPQEYTQRNICLFANDLCDVLTNENIGKYKCIAGSVAPAGDFIFRIKYTGSDDPASYLYKKYTVAVEVEDGYSIVGNSKCITNPENYSNKTGGSVKKTSGKGIYGQSLSFMQEMSVSETVLWVDIGKFFDIESYSENRFECGGYLYYYNSEYANAIETMINNYSDKGISVTLVAVISDTGNSGLNDILIHKDADKNAKYCAYNTSSRQGLMYLRAFCEFFARRYCANALVNRFVFGDEIGNSSYYSMGKKTLNKFTEEYATGLRTVYNAIKSISPNTEVCTYIDGYWDRGLPFDSYTEYDNRALIDSLNNYFTQSGNIGWAIAMDPFEHKYDRSLFDSSDNEFINSVDCDKISFKNIEVAEDYLKQDNMLYNNKSRGLLIIEKSVSNTVDEQTETAYYVYNCYKVFNSQISAYITNKSCNYNNAMKYADTSYSLMSSYFAQDVLGISAWASVIGGFSEEKLATVKIEQSNISFSKPKHKGSVVLFDFSKDENGWESYGFTEKVSGGMSLLGKDGLLSVSPGIIPAGEKRGIVKKFYDAPLDMSCVPYLEFSINTASLPAGVNFADITVILVSGNDVYEVSGSVKEAVWTNVCCDFSAFTGISEVDIIKILFSFDGVESESMQAIITSVNGLSFQYDDKQLDLIFHSSDTGKDYFETVKHYAVPAFTGVIALCAVILIVRTAMRKKHNNSRNINKNKM